MSMLLNALLGETNPLSQWASANSNTLTGLGTSLLNDGMNFTPLQQGRMLDMQTAEKKKEEQKLQVQENATRKLLQEKAPDLAQLLDTGIPMVEVWSEYLRRQQPQSGATPTANMQDWMFGQQNPGYWEALHPGDDGKGTVPPGYQRTEAGLSPIPGGPADPQNPLNMRRTGGGMPSPTIAKEIFEADEGAQAGQNVLKALDTAISLNDSAWDGPGADLRSAAAAMTPWGGQGAVDTQQLQNVVTANALESLKATFGAAPTEGERKILLEVQGSVNQSRAVRKAIFERAKTAANRRLKFNEERARSLRSGTYFDEGYSPVDDGSGGNTTSSGVSWSIEP